MRFALLLLCLAVLRCAPGAGQRPLTVRLERATDDGGRALLAVTSADSASQCGVLCLWHSGCAAVSFDATTPTSSSCRLLGCPDQWTHFNRNCYRLAPQRGPGPLGPVLCRSLHPLARLASVLSAEEDAFLGAMVSSEVQFVCFGFEHRPEWGHLEFRWMDGSPINYTNWMPDPPQPNGFSYDHLFTCWHRTTLKWNDMRIHNESQQYGFVCKM